MARCAALRRAEFIYGAGDAVASAIGLLGIYFVVVGRVRFQASYADAEYCLCVALVQADVRLRALAEVCWILAVVHNAEMLVGAARVVARPPNDHFKILRRFELGALSNLHMCGFLRGRNQLRARRI